MRRFVIVTACVFAPLLWTTDPARAEHPANPTRPTRTENAYPLPPGSMQAEIGYRLDNEDADIFDHSVPFLLRLGAASFVDVRLGIPLIRATSDDLGVGDLTLGARFIANEESTYLPAFGLLTELEVPTASGAFHRDHVGWGVSLLVSKRFGDFVWVNVNVGIDADFGVDGADALSIPAAVAVHFDIFGVIDLFGEFATINRFDHGPEDFSASGVVGAGWRVIPELVIDIAAEVGATKFAPDVTYTAGITWNFADFY
jgi:hypothetical protein